VKQRGDEQAQGLGGAGSQFMERAMISIRIETATDSNPTSAAEPVPDTSANVERPDTPSPRDWRTKDETGLMAARVRESPPLPR
jgi:hypothetical protein